MVAFRAILRWLLQVVFSVITGGAILATFGSFLGCQSIIYVELMAICEGLELVFQLGYSVLEVQSDSTTIVSWIHSEGLVCRYYPYSLCQVYDLASCSTILVRHVLWKAIFATNFLANWACTHLVHRRFWVLEIYLLAYLVFFIWMHKQLLISGSRVV